MIPTTAISTTFLFAKFTQAKSFLERGDVSNGYFSGKAIAERGGLTSEISRFFEEANKTIEYFKNINQHIYQWSLDLLSFTYETLTTIVLQTPLFLFNNSFVKNTSTTFSMISVSIVILFTIYEMIMKLLKKRHTDFKTIIKRFPLAVAATGFAPFLFEKSFELINKITKGITQVGGITLNGSSFANFVTVGEIDVLILLLFDVTLLSLLIPIFLQQGKRWWELFCLSAISPLALSAWVFDRHSHLFHQWWNHIKRLSMVQLVYGTFIVLLGVFIYGTRFISPEMFFVKLLVTIGALTSLSNPPQIVKAYSRGDGDIFSMYDSYKNTALGIYKTVTFKNFRPTQFIKNKQQEKLAKITKLRKQHNRRFVDDLLK
ncbi:hypothetical protein BAOM_3090 [Peribacillus asahii]|uniref:Uncharacterized protein n=1 Tax=Peribacillus asahii TaxID=228899 RepID=A0A3Q9RQ00_9BACI|nr:hypothetical protein BAOM_3090 [Peribacillus asahii]